MSTITLVKILQVHEDSFSSKKEKKKKKKKKKDQNMLKFHNN